MCIHKGAWDGFFFFFSTNLIFTFVLRPHYSFPFLISFILIFIFFFFLLIFDWYQEKAGKMVSEFSGSNSILLLFNYFWLPWWFSSKESACQCRRLRFDPCAGKIPWRREWLPTLVFLPGKSHGQRSLAGYSPWGRKRVGHNLVTKQ